MTDERMVEATVVIGFALLTAVGLFNTIANTGWIDAILNGLATGVLAVLTYGLWKEGRQ